jgi:2-polyprenyl-6-methoxyphenol hydroxylase-like FAD-dependent oxidoreductase
MTNPVLVVGAGPVGLTMAAALTRHGVSCRIIEKTPVPNDKSKALAVWCRTLELLDGLGLAETFVQSGMKLTGGSMYAHGRRLVHLALTSDESKYGFPLMIPQNVTERLLTEHLAQQGVNIERQVELVGFGETPEGVRCTLEHADGREELIDVPWVIGCDGAHSTVRHTLGVEFTGQAEPNDWMLADVQIDGPLAKDEVSIFWHDRGVAAFFPIRQNRFRMIADLGVASDQTLKAELTLTEAQATVDERGPGNLTLSDPVWLAYFRINERKVSDYRKGRALLAGDAAHIHSPAGGQGMNTGMQDAFNLAWKLALIQQGQGRAEPLLESYSIERSAVGDQVLKNAERFTTLATLRSPAARWLRNHIAPILGSFGFVQDKLRNDWFELSINYRHSPLSANHWPRLTGGLSAGDRLCDAPVIGAADGNRTNLLSAIAGTRHTLLLLPGSQAPQSLSQLLKIATDADEAYPRVLSPHVILNKGQSSQAPIAHGVPTWFDEEGRLNQKLHANDPTLILVRPDGYIGFRCQPANGPELLKHMSSYLKSEGGTL